METPKIIERIEKAVMDMRSMNIHPTDVFLCTSDVKQLNEHHYALPSYGETTDGGGVKWLYQLVNIDNTCLRVHHLKSGEHSIITVGDIRESKIIKVL